MYVINADQQGSRRSPDRVEDLLAHFAGLADLPGVVRPFERTVGDEAQAVVSDPAVVVDVALRLVRLGGWSVGVGAGVIDEPLPTSSRAGRGTAFLLAREAVEGAKSRSRPGAVAVRSAVPGPGADAEAVLQLLAAVVDARTPSGWTAVDALVAAGPGATQEDVAARLGITQQAVSQRLRVAHWQEEERVRPVVARLLADGVGGAPGAGPDGDGHAADAGRAARVDADRDSDPMNGATA